MRKAGGRVVLVAGLLALLFGVSRGYEISVHVEVEQHKEKVPKFVSHLELKDREESGFDFFVFSQAWPGTYCKQEGKCCDNVVGDSFVVHGLWPDYNNYSYPSCCSGPPINENELEEFIPILEKYWPSMSCSAPKQCNGETTGNFWQLQWEQHGTCAYPTISSWMGYIYHAANLNARFNLMMYLQLVGGIVPDNNKTYNTNKAIEVLKSFVGATPVFECYDNMINEVWICLSKDLEVQDCPSGASVSCPEEFVFPVFEK